METISAWKTIVHQSMASFLNKFSSGLPDLLAAIGIILLGLLVAKVVTSIVKKLLIKVNVDRLNEKMADSDLFTDELKKMKFSSILSQFLYWILVFLVVITATETLGLYTVSEKLKAVVQFIPQLLSGLILLVLGIYLANLVRNFLKVTMQSLGLAGGEVFSNLIFYFLIFIVILTAMDVISIDISLIKTNLTMIIGAVLLAFVVAFVLATKDILPNIISSIRNKSSLKVGERIEIDNQQGVIKSIDYMNITLETENGELLIPNNRLTSNQ